MAVIHTNTQALFSQNALKVTSKLQTKTMEQLSTGKRINSARDDAAGMAITARMSSQIRSINQAIRNAGDAISLIQTAEGATGTVTNMMQRMRELAIQAINDTNAQDQRGYLDLEFQQLKDEIVRVADHTEWNGFQILNGTAGERVGEIPVFKKTSFHQFANSITHPITTRSLSGPDVGLLNPQVEEFFSGQSGFIKSGQLLVTIPASAQETTTSAIFTTQDGQEIELTGTVNRDSGTITFRRNEGNNWQVLSGQSGSDAQSTDTLVYRISDLTGSATGVLSNRAVELKVHISGGLPALRAGDLKINDVEIGASFAQDDRLSPITNADASAIAKAAAINRQSSATGVFARTNTNIMTGQSMEAGSVVSGLVWVNGFSTHVSSTFNDSRETRKSVVEAINAISQQTGVKAVDSGFDSQGVTLLAQDGRNIEISFETTFNTALFGQSTGLKQGVQASTISLESKINTPVILSSSPNGDISRAGLTAGDYSKNESAFHTAPRPTVSPGQAQVTAVTLGRIISLGDTFSIEVNGRTFTSTSSATTPQAARDELISSINTTFNLEPGFGIFATAGRSSNEILLTSSTVGSGFHLSLSNSNPASSIQSTNLVENLSPDSRTLASDDLVINGVKIRATTALDDTRSSTIPQSSNPAGSALAIANAINSHTHETGVIAIANGATTQGLTTDTSTLPAFGNHGTYSLFINGIEVKVEFEKNEAASTRREKVVNAINSLFGQHGVLASNNGLGVSLETDGRNLSVWLDSDIQGLTAAHFGLGRGDGVAQISRVSLADSEYPEVIKSPDFIQFQSGGRITESLVLSDTAPSTTAGIMTIQNGVLYRGNGTQAVIVGTVDPVLNGQSGKALRINFAAEFVNGGFNGPLVADGNNFKLEGWTIFNEQVRLDGLSTIAGWPTPPDLSDPFRAPTDDTSVLDPAVPFNSRITLDTTNPRSPGGGTYLTIGTDRIRALDGYAVIHGPYLVNDEPVEIPAGSTVSFEWRATVSGDAYDVFAYLLNVDTGETIEMLNQTGATANATTPWATETILVPDTGRYKFVFISGSWDATGGKVLGANLQVDTVKVNASAPPTFTPEEIAQLDAFVTYFDSGAPTQRLEVTIDGVVIQSDALGTASALAANLTEKINLAVEAGLITNVIARQANNGVEVVSTVPGYPFTMSELRVIGDENIKAQISTVRENVFESSGVTPIAGATTSSDSAQTFYGTVQLVASPESKSGSSSFHQAQASTIRLEAGSAGFQAMSNFSALGFQVGNFGGRSTIDMDPPRVGRMSFQVGSSLDQVISIDLADFGKNGAITSAITGDAGLVLDQRSIRINSQSGANDVLRLLDEALDRVNSTQAQMGAVMNRLEFTIENLSNVSLNKETSRSQIQDADFAKASTELAKASILQQAGTAILAQANISQQTVLDLLR